MSASKGSNPTVVYISGDITPSSRIYIGSNKSVIGLGAGAKILKYGLNLSSVSNVIIRNLNIGDIKGNDAITISESTRVWIDHNEFHSNITQGPDYYDGQVDIVHASDYITISWNYFHDHWKVSEPTLSKLLYLTHT